MIEEKKFKYDQRKPGAGMHLLYVKHAVRNLSVIDQFIERLDKLSNTTLASIILAIIKERQTLIEEDSAYADAQEILNLIKEAKVHEGETR